MHRIKLQQWPNLLKANPRNSILDAALDGGVPYPHSCRTGSCGTCKTMLCAGEVVMDDYDPEVLTGAERDAGLILACRARPQSDVEIAWVKPANDTAFFPVRQLKAKVVQLEAATHDITRVRLEVRGAPLEFAAGQFARLRFGGHGARPYSMANLPDDATLEFHVRRVPDGIVSNYVARQLRTGDSVFLEGPFGSAALREPVTKPILLIAGGSGLAPMKSILLQARAKEADCEIHLYHGVRDTGDIYDSEAIMNAGAGRAFRYTPVLSSPANATDHRTGFVHEAVARDFSTLSGYQVFLAGPPPMVDAATTSVSRLGARRENIFSDPFHNSPREEPKRAVYAEPQKKKFFGLSNWFGAE